MPFLLSNGKLYELDIEKDKLKAVKNNGLLLKYFVEQSPKICLEAVRQNGMALKYVIGQTYDICLEAVKQNGMALKYVYNQTDEICMTALKNNMDCLKYIKDKSKKDYYLYILDSQPIPIHIRIRNYFNRKRARE